MKKFILFVVLAGFVFTAKAQLLVSDSTLTSFDNGITFNLTALDSSFHDPAKCRLAYTYTKVTGFGGQQLTNNTYITYDYFPDGNIRQTVTLLWNAGTKTYVNLSRTTLTYYQSTSKKLTSINETWVNNSTWQNSSLQTNTYDANGYLTVNMSQNWDVSSGTWMNNFETDYYNKSNGLADSAINKEYKSNVVINRTKDIYSYVGATSSVYRIINQTRVNNQWQDSSRSTFTYTAGVKIISFDLETYAPQTQSWTLISHQTFVYNANGDLITFTQYLYIQGFAFITQTRYKPKPCTTAVGTPGELCPSGNTTLTAGLTGASYQWQVNTGAGFTNISNNTNYSGATSATLTLSNIPSSWYGYQYRCKVGSQFGPEYTIKFVSKWTGAINNQWETASNWSCGTVPDATTDVIINNGGAPILNSNRSVRSLSANPGAKFTANAGFKLTIMH